MFFTFQSVFRSSPWQPSPSGVQYLAATSILPRSRSTSTPTWWTNSRCPPPKWSYSLFYWRHLELRTNLDSQLHLWSCHNDGNMGKIIWSRHAVASSSLGLNINMQVRRLVVNYQFQARESMCWWWGVWWAFLGLRHLLKTACYFKITTADLVLAILRSGQQYSLRDWMQMS